MKKRLNQLLFSLSLLILVLFFNSCGKSPKEYNNFYFQGKEEKNLNLLQKGFEKAEPYFSQLCVIELSELLPKQKAVELVRRAIKKYPDSSSMLELLLSLLYDQRDYDEILAIIKENKLTSNEIQRFYLSALVKTSLIRNQKTNSSEKEVSNQILDLWGKIQSWYKNSTFSQSHNIFYNEFQTDIMFDPATQTRQLGFLGYYEKAVSVISKTYNTQNDFSDFLQNLSFVELKEIADYFVLGSKDKTVHADFFASGSLELKEKDKSFYSLFSAGRLNEKVNSKSEKNLSYFHSAIYLAPEDSFDRSLWYYIRSAMNYSTSKGYEAFLEFSNAWKDPEYFDDLIEKFSSSLLSNYQWETFYNLFSEIYPYLSYTSQGKTDYIFGALLENNLLPSLGSSKSQSENFYQKAYENPETDEYYRFLAGTKLNKSFKDFSSLINKKNNQNLTEKKATTSEENHFLYLAKNNIEKVYDFYQNNKEKISEEIALAGILALEKASKDFPDFYPMALRIANSAISQSENINHIYPRYFTKEVQSVCKEFDLPEYVLYALIRSESFFDYDIYSSVGAVGLCQLMPSTASDVARKLKQKDFNLLDPKTNITFGGYYLGELRSRIDGNMLLALCSYNAGIENVRKWRRAFPNSPIDIFIETIPFEETRNYAKKLIKASCFYGMLYYQLLPNEIIENMGLF